jgi:hypothetical protein
MDAPLSFFKLNRARGVVRKQDGTRSILNRPFRRRGGLRVCCSIHGHFQIPVRQGTAPLLVISAPGPLSFLIYSNRGFFTRGNFESKMAVSALSALSFAGMACSLLYNTLLILIRK